MQLTKRNLGTLAKLTISVRFQRRHRKAAHRADHDGLRLAGEKSRPDRLRDRFRTEGKFMPLRDLRTNSRRRASRGTVVKRKIRTKQSAIEDRIRQSKYRVDDETITGLPRPRASVR